MQLTFRIKLLLILGTTLATLSSMIAVSTWIDHRQQRILADVEGRLVPKLELGPRLSAAFSDLGRGMQDAVAAQDHIALDRTRSLEREIHTLLQGAKGALPESDITSLTGSIEQYHQVAYDISTRLIEGETGEALVRSVTDMQARHRAIVQKIEATTALEPNELAAGFGAVRLATSRANQLRMTIGVAGLAVLFALSFWIARGVLRPLADLSQGFSRFAVGRFDPPIPVLAHDELGNVAREANEMAVSLRTLGEQRDRQDRLKDGQAGFTERLRGDLAVHEISERALSYLVRHIDAVAGTIYLAGEENTLRRESSHATVDPTPDTASENGCAEFRFGEGLLGQAALSEEIVVMNEPPSGYLTIRSGLGAAPPRSLVFVPLRRLERIVGVIELAFFSSYPEEALEFLDSTREPLAIALEVARSHAAVKHLLEQTREQADRLMAQEEELRVANQDLRAQQEELRQANDELEAQRQALKAQNQELTTARERVQRQVEELARVSSYKSQFLANMSHELRTPLNSMLLLSHLLSENEGGNLTNKQVEHCRTVYGAGQDLLQLINQILDLAKIESGKQEVDLREVAVSDLVEHVRRVFEPVANNKGLDLILTVDPKTPSVILTDGQRAEGILTNLVGNALKFTEQGSISLRVFCPSQETLGPRESLKPETTIAFSVTDTGVGISTEDQETIFRPFEQLETGRRTRGGTGLGLAIAKESAHLLGGDLCVESTLSEGSTFTLFLPTQATATVSAPVSSRSTPSRRAVVTQTNHSRLLMIEDDEVLVEQLSDIIHAQGLEVVVASTGEEGVQLARNIQPAGIILDVKLPDTTGWKVMEQLRCEPLTEDIPVHFLSAVDAAERGLALGAVGYLTKPATREELIGVVRTMAPSSPPHPSKVLVVEDSEVHGSAIVQLLQQENIDAEHVLNATSAFRALSSGAFGCVILDLGLPDLDGLGLLRSIRERTDIPSPKVVVHTGRALTKEELRELDCYAEAVVLKDGRSVERLLDEVRLFIRHVQGGAQSSSAPSEPIAEVSLKGAKLLLADDDMRTVYALSAFLRGKGAEVIIADTGRQAVEEIHRHPDVLGVLMDVMMPEMDGYEAIRKIRQEERFAALPILALTAKAMKGERERCLEAGASDYLPKPVDSMKLLSTVRHWLPVGEAV